MSVQSPGFLRVCGLFTISTCTEPFCASPSFVGVSGYTPGVQSLDTYSLRSMSNLSGNLRFRWRVAKCWI